MVIVMDMEDYQQQRESLIAIIFVTDDSTKLT